MSALLAAIAYKKLVTIALLVLVACVLVDAVVENFGPSSADEASSAEVAEDLEW